VWHVVARSLRLTAEVSELFTLFVFQHVIVSKTASSECILQGTTKMDVGDC